MKKTKDRTKEIEKRVDEFIKNNPEIEKALEIFKIGMDKYREALEFINRPQTYSANSTNSELLHN